jgi:hypothetical protein
MKFMSEKHYKQIKNYRDGNPDHGPGKSLTKRRNMAFSIKHPEI